MERPLGVTLLALLAAVAGILGLCGALLVFGVSLVGGLVAFPIAAVGGTIGIVLAISPVLELIFAYGAWTLRPWAWWLGIFATGISILSSIFALFTGVGAGATVTHGILPLIIFVYLLFPDVRRAFHQA